MKRPASSEHLVGGAKQRKASETEPIQHADPGIAALNASEPAVALPQTPDMLGAAAAVLINLDVQQSSAAALLAPAGPAAAAEPLAGATHSLPEADAAAGTPAAAGEQQAAADPGALEQRHEPSHAQQRDSGGLVAAPNAVSAVPEASKGSMLAAQPDEQQSTQTAAGMSVSDLKAVLARVCADKRQVRAHMVPVRYLTKLLHGTDVDHSIVQLATLLPQVGVLLSHMQDRVAGKVVGKEAMAPHKAAAHAAALQHVLGCGEVQAELGQQQVSQLLTAVSAAEQEFEAAGLEMPSDEQAAPASTEGRGHAADGVAAATREETGVGSIAQQGAQRSLSVAQLLVQSKTLPCGWSVTALRKLLLLVHGREADPTAVQVADLLPQWPLLQAHLLQRVEGKGEEPPLKPYTAYSYTQGIVHCLALPSVQAQLDAATLAQLQQQLQDGKKLRSMPDRTALASGPGVAKATAGATSTAAAATAAAVNRPQRGAAAGGLPVAQLLDVLQASSFSKSTVSRAQLTVKKLLLLVHGPDADAAAVQASSLLQEWPVLCADLQQRVSGPTPTMKPSSAGDVYVASLLRVLRMPEVQAQFDSAVLQQLQRQVAADRAAFFALAGQGRAGDAQGSSACESDSNEDEWQGADSDDNSGPPGVVDQQLQTMTLGQLKGRLSRSGDSRDCRVAINGVAKAAGFDEASRDSQPLPAVLQVQHVEGFLSALRERGCSAVHINNMTRWLRCIVSERAHADVQCCLGPVRVQQLQQALKLAATQQAETESALAAAAAGGGKSKPAALQHSGGNIDHHGPAGRARAAAVAAAAASSQPAGQRLLRSAGQPVAAVPASATGLSLNQVAAYAKLCFGRTTELLGALTPLRCIAKMLYGDGFDPDAVQVAQLLQHWGDFEAQLLQQVAGTHPTLPTLARATALPYATRLLLLLDDPMLQPHVSAAALKQLRKQVAATKDAISSMDAAGLGQSNEPSQPHGGTVGQGVLAAGDEQPAGSAPDVTTADSNAAGQWRAGSVATALAAQQLAAGAVSAQTQPSGLLAPGAAGPSQGAALLTDAPVRNLPIAQRQLLRLYADKLSPSLAEKLALRSTLQMLAGLPPGDIRLDSFFAEYDWMVMLSQEAESTPQHWREAFDTLTANATRGP